MSLTCKTCKGHNIQQKASVMLDPNATKNAFAGERRNTLTIISGGANLNDCASFLWEDEYFCLDCNDACEVLEQ